jgi:hypothetical protein
MWTEGGFDVSANAGRGETSGLSKRSAIGAFALCAVLGILALASDYGYAKAVPASHPWGPDSTLPGPRFAPPPGVRFHGLPPGSFVRDWVKRRGVYLMPPWHALHSEDSSGEAGPEESEGSEKEGAPQVSPEGAEGPGSGEANALGLRCEPGYCPAPPLRFKGGVVQREPRLHLIFWGSNWNEATGSALKAQLLTMFEGISGTGYHGILTQYFDATGHIASTFTVDSMIDTRVSAPSGVADKAIEEEVAYALSQKSPGWKRELNQQFMVLTAPGTTYAENFKGFCAYHDVDSTGIGIYSIVPYAGDEPFKKSCQSYGKSNVANATSVMASHEYAESVTDPLWDTAPGWQDLEGYEVTDICSSVGDELPNGSYVQGQYDNHQNACSLSDENPPSVLAITESATGVTKEKATLHGTVNPEGLSTTYKFEYGTSKSYGTSIPSTPATIGSGKADVGVEAALSGLQLEQVYHYRVVATNSSGTTYGEDRTFIPSKWLIDENPTEPSSTSDWLNAVSCATEAQCMAVGHYYNSLVGNTALSYERKGGEWIGRAVPIPKETELAEFSGVACLKPDACTAVGYVYLTSSEKYVPLVGQWNGSSWSTQSLALPAGTVEAYFTDVSCPTAGECMAVGSVTSSGGVQSNYSAILKNGSWTSLTTPTDASSKGARLEDVWCVSATFCTAVGWFNANGAHQSTLVWNGEAWSAKTPAMVAGVLYGVTGHQLHRRGPFEPHREVGWDSVDAAVRGVLAGRGRRNVEWRVVRHEQFLHRGGCRDQQNQRARSHPRRAVERNELDGGDNAPGDRNNVERPRKRLLREPGRLRRGGVLAGQRGVPFGNRAA